MRFLHYIHPVTPQSAHFPPQFLGAYEKGYPCLGGFFSEEPRQGRIFTNALKYFK